VKLIVPGQLPRQPEEGLFKVVVGFCGNVVVLQVLLSVERDLLRLHLPVLDFHLVPREHNGDIFTDAGEIAMPVGDVFVGNAGGDVEHDDGTLSLDVVAIAQASEFLLPGRVPDVEFDGSAVSVKDEGMDFDAESGDVFFLEFPR